MASVQANGITIEYERSGAGEPLLLIMGLGGQLIAWPAGLVEEFERLGFDVIRHDNRDVGLSTEIEGLTPSPVRVAAAARLGRPTNVPYLLADMADDAAGLLDALGLESVHVAGVSMGGMIAQTLAIRHPERVRTLTSIMSNTGDGKRGGPHPKVLAAFARRRPPSTPEQAVEQSVQTFRLISGPHFDEAMARRRAEDGVARSFRPHGVLRQMAAIVASPDRTEALRKVTAPTLVVHGLKDRLVRPNGGIATSKAIPGSRLLLFPDMGHDLPEPRWSELADAIARNAQRPAVPAAVGQQ